MKNIITERTANTTPNKHWDYAAFYDGQDGDNIQEWSYGETPEKAIQNFKDEYEG